LQGFCSRAALARRFPSRTYPAPLAVERFEVAVKSSDRFTRRFANCGTCPSCLRSRRDLGLTGLVAAEGVRGGAGAGTRRNG
jgi:hypothetical protein